ncbi:MAG: hypothetical protein D3919_11475 [Candidatus Electrothrix sp. AW5]|nr:hypothetical protein [Candidatus Electrothrix gigas]
MSRAFFRRKKGELSDFSSGEGIRKYRSKERKSIGRGNQKASLEGKEKHRARELESIARRKGKVSGEGMRKYRPKEMKSIGRGNCGDTGDSQGEIRTNCDLFSLSFAFPCFFLTD